MPSHCFRLGSLFVVLPVVFGGCQNSSGGAEEGPIGPVARNAQEAWPTRPTNVPVLTREEIAGACAHWVACTLPENIGSGQGVGACVGNVTWSLERAIPLSSLMEGFERPEFFVACVLGAADCTAVTGCFRPRGDNTIFCEEDGCRAAGGQEFAVTCSGNIASAESSETSFMRDCASAFAECDPESPTGCTDRLFTQCAPDDEPGDRCEGNIRLGCDSRGQVSYRDCERMGGTCGTNENGEVGCNYGPPDPECAEGMLFISRCEAGEAVVCVAGKLTRVPSPELCG